MYIIIPKHKANHKINALIDKKTDGSDFLEIIYMTINEFPHCLTTHNYNIQFISFQYQRQCHQLPLYCCSHCPSP